MAERPIVVAEAPKILDAAGRVGFMAARAVERRVQQADIEPAVAPRRIGGDEVRSTSRRGKLRPCRTTRKDSISNDWPSRDRKIRTLSG